MTESARPVPAPCAPHWDDLPIALVDRGRLRAVTAAAGRMRVRAGMTVTEARALCASLEMLPWDDVMVDAAITKATAAMLIASPQVTPVAGAPGLWWVGASGFDALGGERALARALLRVARLWHPAPRVAIASSCVAARAATWASHQAMRLTSPGGGDAGLVTIVPPDGCAAYLAPAPLALVPMEEELRWSLSALGLRTVGAFAALDPGDVERRWGSSGLAAWRLARGEDRRRPVLARAEARRMVSAELATPASTMEPVLFLVRAALDRLVTGLVADGRAALAVAVTLTLDDGRGALPAGGMPHTVTRELRMPRAVARVAPLFERCRALLDRWPLEAPVSGVAVAIAASAPASGEQGELLDAAWRDPAAVDAALERLRAELGPNVVVRPVARPEHRPETAGAWVEADDAGLGRVPAEGGRVDSALGEAGPSAECPVPSADATAFRLLEAPEPVEVEADGEAPAAAWWRGRRVAFERAEGPERLSGDWWKDAFARDYWRCRGDTGELLLYRDRAAGGAWYVHGWYD